MKYFAVCPVCGKKLCKAEDGSVLEVQCPHCKEQVDVVVENGIVSVSKSKSTTHTK